LLEQTGAAPQEHVFTLHAELEGMKLAPVLEALLTGWRKQGYRLVPMRDLTAGMRLEDLPLHTVIDAPVPGRSGTLAVQGPAFLAGESSL
jgi:undecaprenyl phosphate-alpha-L-ara4FN deformylase